MAQGKFRSVPIDPGVRVEITAEDEEARRGFLTLQVPVEGHAVVCQRCGSLVLDNRNALSAHRDDHGGS